RRANRILNGKRRCAKQKCRQIKIFFEYVLQIAFSSSLKILPSRGRIASSARISIIGFWIRCEWETATSIERESDGRVRFTQQEGVAALTVAAALAGGVN